MENKLSLITDYFDQDFELTEIEEIQKLLEESVSSVDELAKAACLLVDSFFKLELRLFKFPILKSIVFPKIEGNLKLLEKSVDKQYFTLELLKQYSTLRKKLFSHYKLSLSPIQIAESIEELDGKMTKEVMKHKSFSKFIDNLSDWHISTEMNIFYIFLVQCLVTDSGNELVNIQEELLNADFSATFGEKTTISLLSLMTGVTKRLNFHVESLNFMHILLITSSCMTFGMSIQKIFDPLKSMILVPMMLNTVPSYVHNLLKNYTEIKAFKQVAEKIEVQAIKARSLESNLGDLIKIMVIEKSGIELSINKKASLLMRAKKIKMYVADVFAELENVDEEVKKLLLKEAFEYEEQRVEGLEQSFILVNKK